MGRRVIFSVFAVTKTANRKYTRTATDTFVQTHINYNQIHWGPCRWLLLCSGSSRGGFD